MHINQYIINRLKEEDIKEYTCVELIMNSIRKDTIICNPGILGSGILATNLSQESNTTILEYSNMLVCIYSNIKYKDYDGKLYRDRIK
jgi:23S rRNA (adenine2030-N6)-methyltransferase